MFKKDSAGNVSCTCGKSLREHSADDIRKCAAENPILRIDADTWAEMTSTVKYVGDPEKGEKKK